MRSRNNQALSENEDNSTFVAFIKITIMTENKNKEKYIVYCFERPNLFHNEKKKDQRAMDFVVNVVIQNSDAQLMPLAEC